MHMVTEAIWIEKEDINRMGKNWNSLFRMALFDSKCLDNFWQQISSGNEKATTNTLHKLCWRISNIIERYIEMNCQTNWEETYLHERKTPIFSDTFFFHRFWTDWKKWLFNRVEVIILCSFAVFMDFSPSAQSAFCFCCKGSLRSSRNVYFFALIGG